MDRFRHRVQGQQGAAVVEFALTAMILIVLLFGMWDFGRLFDAWLVTTNAAREGARYGAIYGADQNTDQNAVISGIVDAVDNYLEPEFGSGARRSDIQSYSVDTNSANVFPDPGGRMIGNRVVVTVSAQVELGPLIKDLIFGGSATTTIIGKATMRI